MNPIPVLTSLYGLAAAVSWGTADYFAAKASKRKTPDHVALSASIIGTVIYAIIYAFNPGQLHWTRPGFLFAAASGICIELGILLFYRGLDAGPVSIVSPIGSAYPLVTTLVVVTLFGGVLHLLDIIGILIVTAGVVIASGAFEMRKSHIKSKRGVLHGLVTFVLWGIGYALFGKAVSLVGWEKATLVNVCAGFVALSTLLTYTSGTKLWRGLGVAYLTDKYILGVALIQLLGGIIFSIGLAHARSTAVITTVSASYPALTIFLSLKYLGEKKQILPLAGAFITIAGVIILSI